MPEELAPQTVEAGVERLRILQLYQSAGYGGIERHVALLSAGLRAQGQEVVVAGLPGSWLAGACRESGVPFEPLRLRGMLDPASMWRLRRLIRGGAFDVVHGHGVRAAHFVGWGTAGLNGVVALCTAHSTHAHRHMRRCRHVIAVSEAVRANLLREGHRPARVSVVYNGIAAPLAAGRATIRAELGIGPDEFAVFSAGRFIHDKGQDLMVEAIERTRHPMRLFLAGDTGGGFGERVRAGGSTRTVFLGYRADVQRLLGGFDAYLSASRREALGLSLIEACAAGLPIVATAVGGVPEVVADGVNGLLVPSGDSAALAAALDRLVESPEEAAAMGAQGRLRYDQRFTVKAMVGQTLALYRSLRAGA